LSLINALKTFIPDILITDFNLVGMDAFDVLRIVKEYNHKIPVVVITAHLKNEADRDLLMEKGAAGFFIKEPIATLNERLLPLFQSIVERNQENLENLERERKRYVDRKSQSDFLRAHDYESEDNNTETRELNFWDFFRSLFTLKKNRV